MYDSISVFFFVFFSIFFLSGTLRCASRGAAVLSRTGTRRYTGAGASSVRREAKRRVVRRCAERIIYNLYKIIKRYQKISEQNSRYNNKKN